MDPCQRPAHRTRRPEASALLRCDATRIALSRVHVMQMHGAAEVVEMGATREEGC